ncbi:hypothetical protein [Salinispora oceanensis]|uniref:hypothetical protein n=1 Tax=Salinispora oceanensis TaxID=1050199 RepID=UPI001CC713F8|nr:hypothetical protein [Salinispora oceanensis]
MSAPRLRITCCLCRKPVPRKSDVYALDLEWQRRYPQMAGILACGTCAVSSTYFFRCRRTHNDAYVPGHLPVADQSESRATPAGNIRLPTRQLGADKPLQPHDSA